MLLGDIIKQYRSEHKMSMQTFADLIHSSKSYISMIEKNYNPATGKPINPSLETLKLISEAIHVDIDTLLKMLDDNQEILLNEKKYKEQFKNKSIATKIPVLGSIPAGVPIELIEDIIGYEDISEDMLKGGKEYFALKVKGSSMWPKYIDGDTIIVLKQDNCESGEDCIVMVNGNDGTFKRVIKKDTGIILEPINQQEYNSVSYSNEDIEKLPVRILGVVKELRRSI